MDAGSRSRARSATAFSATARRFPPRFYVIRVGLLCPLPLTQAPRDFLFCANASLAGPHFLVYSSVAATTTFLSRIENIPPSTGRISVPGAFRKAVFFHDRPKASLFLTGGGKDHEKFLLRYPPEKIYFSSRLPSPSPLGRFLTPTSPTPPSEHVPGGSLFGYNAPFRLSEFSRVYP